MQQTTAPVSIARPPEGANWTMDELFSELLGPLGVPVLAGVAIGHGPKNLAFSMGSRAELTDDGLRLETPGDA